LVSNARRPEIEYIVVEGRLPSAVSMGCPLLGERINGSICGVLSSRDRFLMLDA
jgi:hypothetical protein